MTRRPRLFIVDPNLKTVHGHYLSYAARVSAAAQALGVAPTIVANREAEADVTGLDLLPILKRNYWEEMIPAPEEDPFEHLAGSAWLFATVMEGVLADAGMCSRDVVFLPYANLAETLALARLAHVLGDRLPRLVLLFRRELAEQGDDTRLGRRSATVLLRQALGELYASGVAPRVRLLTDSDELTEDYSEALRRNVQTAPIPVDPRLASTSSSEASPVAAILYLGDARTEKGYHLLPRLAEALADRFAAGQLRLVAQSNFNIPGGETGIAEARTQLRRVAGVELLEEPLAEGDYIDRLRSAHLVLLPYAPSRYVARSSGILAEAIVAGVPSVVPGGTWLSDQSRRFGAGLTFDGSAESLLRAVSTAIAVLPALRARAADRRGPFAEFHNPTRLVRFVCGADVLADAAAHRSWRLEVEAARPIAVASPDHLCPHGTAHDNSRNARFNQKLYRLFPASQPLRIMDLGCSGGGFVKACLDDGHVAIGLEGSDYSQRTARAEWATIPDRLFTCDISGEFTVRARRTDADERLASLWDVVTAWEVIEHIREADLPVLCENVDRHLSPGGLWIMSVSPNEEVVAGVSLHQTVRPHCWWQEFFDRLGFVNQPHLVGYFGNDWVRGPLQGAENSFHFVLARRGDPVTAFPADQRY